MLDSNKKKIDAVISDIKAKNNLAENMSNVNTVKEFLNHLKFGYSGVD